MFGEYEFEIGANIKKTDGSVIKYPTYS